MNLQEKFNILLTKFNLGKFDEVIFEATLMSKKYPAQEVFINLLSLSYQAKGEFNKSILILEFNEINHLTICKCPLIHA